MRVPTTLAAMPLLLTLPLQSRCSPPPMAGVISIHQVGAHCEAKATDVVVPDVDDSTHVGAALWFVLNSCETKAPYQRITVGKFQIKGASAFSDVVYDCEGVVLGSNGGFTKNYLQLAKGEAGVLRCRINEFCAPKTAFVAYKYRVCANGTFIKDPDLRVKGGNGGIMQTCGSLSQQAAEERCARDTATQ